MDKLILKSFTLVGGLTVVYIFCRGVDAISKSHAVLVEQAGTSVTE